MKKLIILIPMIFTLLTGCTSDTHTINIRVPAGTLVNPMLSYVPFSYSNEEFCPTGDTIKVTLPEPAPNVSFTLIPVNSKDRLQSHKMMQLTPGKTVEIPVEKGIWYNAAFVTSNNSNADIVYQLEIENVKVRTKETVD